MISSSSPAGSRTWFTADTHFGHADVIRMCGRPFSTVGEMDETLSYAWNSVVGPRDEVWHLGDFALCSSPARCRELFDGLHGRKHLVIGNHDRTRVLDLPWASKHDLVRVGVGRTSFVCCHYALRSWPGVFRGTLHVYGHTHATLGGTARSCDVGVDAWNYRPVDVTEILERMRGSDSEPEELVLARARHDRER